MVSVECEPITGLWGRSPQRSPRAEGQGAKPPWSWKPFSFRMPNGSSKFASFSIFCKFPKPWVFLIHLSKNWRYNTVLLSPAALSLKLTYGSDWRVKLQTWPTPFPAPVKTYQICINLRNNLWQKWVGHVHPVAKLLYGREGKTWQKDDTVRWLNEVTPSLRWLGSRYISDMVKYDDRWLECSMCQNGKRLFVFAGVEARCDTQYYCSVWTAVWRFTAGRGRTRLTLLLHSFWSVAFLCLILFKIALVKHYDNILLIIYFSTLHQLHSSSPVMSSANWQVCDIRFCSLLLSPASLITAS